MIIWIVYGFVALILALFVFPFLRMMGLNLVFSSLITIMAIFGGASLAKIYIVIPFMVWEYELHLHDHYPLIKVVKEKAPDEYKNYIQNIDRVLHHNLALNNENEIYYSSLFINELLIKYGPYATNESVYQFFQVNLDFDKFLLQGNPFFVLFHEFPEKFSPDEIDFKGVDPKIYLYNLFYNAEAIVISGLNHDQGAPNKADEKTAEDFFKKILADFSKEYRVPNINQILKNPEDPGVSDELAAKIIIDFYEKILQQGEVKASLLLRVMLHLDASRYDNNR